MATNTEQRKIEIIADGKKANASIKEMRAAVALLNNQLDKLPQGTQEFVEKSNELKAVKSRLNQVQREAKSVDEGLKGVVNQMLSMTPFGGMVGNITSKLGGMKGGVEGLSGGFNTLGKAIIASGIGLLLGVLSQLYIYLTTTQEGMDKVTAVTRPLLAIFEKLKGVAQELGKNVFAGLAKILNGDLEEGLEILKNGAVDAVEGVSEAVTEGWKAGKQLDDLQKQIEQDEIKTIARRKELERIAKEMNFIVEDETQSYEKRREAVHAALAAQEELEQIQLDMMDKRIEKMRLEHSLNDTSRENEKELAELMAQRDEIQASVIEMRTTTRNKLNTINKQEQAEYEKMIADKLKAEQEYAKKVEETERALADLRISLIKDETERSIAEIQLRFERELEAFEGTEAQRIEFLALKEQERDAAIAAIREESRQKKMESDLSNMDEEEALKEAKLQEQFLLALSKEAERDQALLDLHKTTLEQKLQYLTEAGLQETLQAQEIKNQILAIEKEKVDQKLAEEKRLAEEKEKIEAMSYEAAGDFLQLGLDLMDKEEKEKGKHVEVFKAFSMAKVAVDSQQEIAAIWKNSQTSPIAMLLGPVAGTVLAVAQTALAVNRARKTMQMISSQGFYDGGFTSALSVNGGGKLVDRTGHAVAGVVHENEWVGPEWMVQDPKYASTIAWLESERTRRYAEGGYTGASMASAPGQNENISSELLSNIQRLQSAFQAYAGRVDNWANTLTVNNDPRDIESGLSALNQIKQDSTIG
jgi:uncharacterized protein YoxC